MDARAMVETAFDEFEKIISDMSTDGSELARVTAQYRGMVGRTKTRMRKENPKVTEWAVKAACDGDEDMNVVLEEMLQLENIMAVNRERLYLVKKKLDQGRTWSVDERTGDMITASWGDFGGQ